jgi:hypothetical protein
MSNTTVDSKDTFLYFRMLTLLRKSSEHTYQERSAFLITLAHKTVKRCLIRLLPVCRPQSSSSIVKTMLF